MKKTNLKIIEEQKNLSKNYVSSLSDVTDSALSLVLDATADLNIVKVVEFNELSDDYSDFKNCVVICDKVAANVKEFVSSYIINIPKTKDWQIKDYIKTKCSGISDDSANWLYEACCHDINKIDNELNIYYHFIIINK